MAPRTRTPSNAPSHNSIHPSGIAPRPSFERTRTPSTLAPRPSLDKRHPSFDAPRPSFEARRPSFDVPRTQHPNDVRRPSFDAPRTQHPTDVRRPSFDVPRPSIDRAQPNPGSVPPPHAPVLRPPRTTPTMPPSSGIPFPSSAPATGTSVPESERNIDTRSGGGAGIHPLLWTVVVRMLLSIWISMLL
ncbi:hypothetical protein AZE42_09757 [Rhizopogon vesiculosus]|uniref:Uncharacterized protein n=1 Tax=Rhizopogon vesiculosus TaxID=180088 RepID=A0A1J8PMH7_9AGAM|nr:hypothetical protein AZE42_09757 [Rhizopogon vesiculosus]